MSDKRPATTTTTRRPRGPYVQLPPLRARLLDETGMEMLRIAARREVGRLGCTKLAFSHLKAIRGGTYVNLDDRVSGLADLGLIRVSHGPNSSKDYVITGITLTADGWQAIGQTRPAWLEWMEAA